jgi:hypothetical protein
MHRRLILAGLAATGGVLTSAFLQVAVAAADAAADVSATGADAFTIGGYTFDPFLSPGVEGWDLVAPLVGSSPLLTLGGGTVLGFYPLATQDLEVYSPAGADLGSVDTNELRIGQAKKARHGLVTGIDAASALDPGNAFGAGLDAATEAATRWPSSVYNEDQRIGLNSTTEHPSSLGAWDVRRLRPWLLSLPSKVGRMPSRGD